LLGARTADECAGFLTPGSFEAFRHDFGLSYTRASVVLVVAAPGAMAGNIFPVLGDHRSRRAIAVTGAFGYAAALLLFGLTPAYPMLVVASFALGMSATALVHATEIALVDVAGTDVTAYFARGMVFGAAGALLGPAVLVAAAAGGFGWRAAFIVCAVPMAGYGAWLARLPLPRPSRPDPHGRPVRALAVVLRDPRVWYCGLLALVVGPLQQPLTAFLIAYLERVRHAPAALATTVPMAWVAGATGAALLGSRRGTRAGARALTRNASVLFASTLGAVAIPSIPVVMLCMAANGVGLTRFFLALKTRIASLHPGRLGSVSAIVTTLEFAGFVLPLLAGTLADAFGVQAGLAFYAAIGLLLVFVVQLGERYFNSSRAI